MRISVALPHQKHISFNSIPWIPRIYFHVSIFTNKGYDNKDPQSLKYSPYAIQHFAKITKEGGDYVWFLASNKIIQQPNPKNS